MTEFDIDRRKLLKAGGATLMLAVAGCTGGGDDGGGDGDDGGDGGDVPSEVDSHLSEANGYDGTVADMMGQDSVTIENGVNEPDYAFDPAAVRVSTGTEITWEWATDGHSVTATDGADFDSGIENSGFTHSETFDESGIVLYECTPHAAIGQRGAVVVE